MDEHHPPSPSPKSTTTHSPAAHIVSLGQWGRHVSAPGGLTVNGGQGRQTPPPAGLYVPCGHCTGVALSSLEHEWPAGHVHDPMEEVPLSAKGVFAGQGVQPVAPLEGEKVPKGHGLQTPAPNAL
jgi:hypothetical protein